MSKLREILAPKFPCSQCNKCSFEKLFPPFNNEDYICKASWHEINGRPLCCVDVRGTKLCRKNAKRKEEA